MKAKLTIVLFLLGLLPAFAAEEVIFTCENKKCHFHATCASGSGFNFEQLSGYCFVCRKFVSISWDRKKSPPPGLKAVWVPQDSRGLLDKKDRNLFPCPHCKNYVYSFSIRTNTKERFDCPKCLHHTLRAEARIAYD